MNLPGRAWIAGCALLAAFCAGAVPVVRAASARIDAVIPAEIIGNHFIVTLKWDKQGPWRFLVDTGSTTNLVSPGFARLYATDKAVADLPEVRVHSPSGDTVMLTGVQISRIELDGLRLKNVPALVYDCSALSSHFGVKIDGILGFSLFRDLLVTLDYPQSRLLLRSSSAEPPLLPGRTVHFNNDQRVPFIPVEIDGRSLLVLIDSGSDGPLRLNPLGLAPRFSSGPRPGGTVGTLTGDRPQEIGRLDQNLTIGGYTFAKPVVELTDDVSSLGGGLLRQFVVTLDQVRNQVTFYRESTAPIETPSLRNAGLSFQKFSAYWRVLGVVPGSPADEAGVQTGDLVTRINGEPVSQWPLKRYNDLVRSDAPAIDFTFLNGREETARDIRTFELVH